MEAEFIEDVTYIYLRKSKQKSIYKNFFYKKKYYKIIKFFLFNFPFI